MAAHKMRCGAGLAAFSESGSMWPGFALGFGVEDPLRASLGSLNFG